MSQITKDRSLSDHYMALNNGTILENNKYEIIELLYYGENGFVYKAKNIYNNSYVAIKEFCPTSIIHYTNETLEYERDKQSITLKYFTTEKFKVHLRLVDKFIEESKLLSTLSASKYIVTLLETFELNNSAYIVLEYIEHLTLNQYLQSKKELSSQRLMYIFNELICAVSVIHDANILHRDLKPDNIFINGDSVIIGDFGISKQFSQLDCSKTITYSDYYSAPEQKNGSHVQGIWTDIYSLGKILEHTMLYIKENNLDPKSHIDKDQINSIIQSCTRENPMDRPKNLENLKNLFKIKKEINIKMLSLMALVLVLASCFIGFKFLPPSSSDTNKLPISISDNSETHNETTINSVLETNTVITDLIDDLEPIKMEELVSVIEVEDTSSVIETEPTTIEMNELTALLTIDDSTSSTNDLEIKNITSSNNTENDTLVLTAEEVEPVSDIILTSTDEIESQIDQFELETFVFHTAPDSNFDFNSGEIIWSNPKGHSSFQLSIMNLNTWSIFQEYNIDTTISKLDIGALGLNPSKYRLYVFAQPEGELFSPYLKYIDFTINATTLSNKQPIITKDFYSFSNSESQLMQIIDGETAKIKIFSLFNLINVFETTAINGTVDLTNAHLSSGLYLVTAQNNDSSEFSHSILGISGDSQLKYVTFTTEKNHMYPYYQPKIISWEKCDASNIRFKITHVVTQTTYNIEIPGTDTSIDIDEYAALPGTYSIVASYDNNGKVSPLSFRNVTVLFPYLPPVELISPVEAAENMMTFNWNLMEHAVQYKLEITLPNSIVTIESNNNSFDLSEILIDKGVYSSKLLYIDKNQNTSQVVEFNIEYK